MSQGRIPVRDKAQPHAVLGSLLAPYEACIGRMSVFRVARLLRPGDAEYRTFNAVPIRAAGRDEHAVLMTPAEWSEVLAWAGDDGGLT